MLDVDKKSLLMLALGAVLATALFASLFVFQVVVPAQPAQIPKPAQAPQTLQKVRVSFGGIALSTYEGFILVRDVGKEQGIYAKYGLDPEFTYNREGEPGWVGIKEKVASGTKMGFVSIGDVFLARANGVPVKVVAGYIGDSSHRIFVRPDGPIKTVKDLDGKGIGVLAIDDVFHRSVLYLSEKSGIKPVVVPAGNETNRVVALKLGRVDALISASSAPLRLVDSGELRILVQMRDVYPKPFTVVGVFATDDAIEQNPDLLGRFVRATLETVRHIKENPSYAADLYTKITNAPRDLADRAVSHLDWQPSGRGSGQELAAAVANAWQASKESGQLPAGIDNKIEELVDIRFLP